MSKRECLPSVSCLFGFFFCFLNGIIDVLTGAMGKHGAVKRLLHATGVRSAPSVGACNFSRGLARSLARAR